MFANEWSVKSGGVWQAAAVRRRAGEATPRPAAWIGVRAAVLPAWNRSHGVWSGTSVRS